MVGGHKHGFEQVVWFVAQGRGGLQAQARGGNENLLLQEIITAEPSGALKDGFGARSSADRGTARGLIADCGRKEARAVERARAGST